jgi:ribonuclease P protein component
MQRHVAARHDKVMPRNQYSFPKSRRLTRPSEFERVKKDGRVERGKFMLLSVLGVGSDAPFRAGFVTSRRIGGAVVRNRVRRKLREIVRRHQHEIVSGKWIVTIARTPASAATHQQLADEWLRLAKRASILTL